jgi:hypothetical protein
MTNATLLKNVEELSAHVATLEADNTRLREENARLREENRLLRQKLDQYIRHYFGGQRNEGLDKHQLELLLQGLANVVTLPTPEPKPFASSRNGTPHPVRRMLAEETGDPRDRHRAGGSPGSARRLEKDQRGTHRTVGLGGRQDHQAGFHSPTVCERRAVCHRTVAAAAD